jgi:UDP-glucose 4-epimerase
VTDVVESLVRAGESKIHGEIFNVGSGDTYTINRLVKILGGEVVHLPKRPGEPDCTFADTQKISQALDWQPRVSFEEGVQVMVDNIESWRDAPVWDTESITEATKDWFDYLGKKPVGNPDAKS